MASHEPPIWNVVVLGAWNRAILTPGGISTRLFGLPKGSRIEVLVPIEGLEPPKVMHEGLIVTASSSRLEVQMKQTGYECMRKALDTATKALEDLPETPVRAAGYNIRYDIPTTELEDSDTVQSPLNALSDHGYEVVSHGLLHQVRFGKGVINLKTVIEGGRLNLELNFHRDSEDRGELIKWLGIPVDKVKEQVSKLTSAFGIHITEKDNA